jgi:hypothetical protein
MYDRFIVGPRAHRAGIMGPLPPYLRCSQPHNPLRTSLAEPTRVGLRMARIRPPPGNRTGTGRDGQAIAID